MPAPEPRITEPPSGTIRIRSGTWRWAAGETRETAGGADAAVGAAAEPRLFVHFTDPRHSANTMLAEAGCDPAALDDAAAAQLARHPVRRSWLAPDGNTWTLTPLYDAADSDADAGGYTVIFGHEQRRIHVALPGARPLGELRDGEIRGAWVRAGSRWR